MFIVVAMSERNNSSLNLLYDQYCIVVCSFRLIWDLPVTRPNCIGK